MDKTCLGVTRWVENTAADCRIRSRGSSARRPAHVRSNNVCEPWSSADGIAVRASDGPMISKLSRRKIARRTTQANNRANFAPTWPQGGAAQRMRLGDLQAVQGCMGGPCPRRGLPYLMSGCVAFSYSGAMYVTRSEPTRVRANPWSKEIWRDCPRVHM